MKYHNNNLVGYNVYWFILIEAVGPLSSPRPTEELPHASVQAIGHNTLVHVPMPISFM